jgi:hypothetical protein
VRVVVDNKHVDSAIRQALGGNRAEKGGACPDRNLTAAYLENRLRDDERAVFESHAADCATCRQVLALAMTLEEDPDSVPAVRQPSSSKLLFRISIPVSALALIVAGVAVGILSLRSPKTPMRNAPSPQITELRAPAQPQPPPQEKIRKEPVSPAAAPIRKPAEVTTTAARPPAAELTRKAEPAKESLKEPAPVATPTVVPAELAELEAGRAQKQEVAAAKTEFAAARNEDAAIRPAIQARGGAAGFAGGVVGGVVGGAVGGISPPPPQRTQRVSMVNATATPREAIESLSKLLGASDKDESGKAKMLALELKSGNRSRKIGDHTFVSASGYWVDELCARNTEAPIVEVRTGVTEFEEILKLYPDLRTLLPAIVYWNDKTWVLR